MGARASRVIGFITTAGASIALAGIAQAAAAPPVAAPDPAVELAKAAAWPIAVVVLAILFRGPVANFLVAAGGRMTKLSVFNVGVELAPAAAASAPVLNEIRQLADPATVADSTRVLALQVQSGPQAEFAVIDLGAGDEWITSRLYIAAVLMRRTRGVKVFVFTVPGGVAGAGHLVAVAPVETLRWALAQREPWLELAWIGACAGVFADNPLSPTPSPAVTSAAGALDGWKAVQILDDFKRRLQQPSVPPPPLDLDNWVELAGGVREHASFVTPELIRALLPANAAQEPVDIPLDAPRGRRTRAVLRRAGQDWVALTDPKGAFRGLTNRRDLVEDVAAQAAQAGEGADAS